MTLLWGLLAKGIALIHGTQREDRSCWSSHSSQLDNTLSTCHTNWSCARGQKKPRWNNNTSPLIPWPHWEVSYLSRALTYLLTSQLGLGYWVLFRQVDDFIGVLSSRDSVWHNEPMESVRVSACSNPTCFSNTRAPFSAQCLSGYAKEVKGQIWPNGPPIRPQWASPWSYWIISLFSLSSPPHLSLICPVFFRPYRPHWLGRILIAFLPHTFSWCEITNQTLHGLINIFGLSFAGGNTILLFFSGCAYYSSSICDAIASAVLCIGERRGGKDKDEMREIKQLNL